MAKAHFDFGHGGRDPGALGNGLREKDLTLAIGMKTAKIVEKHGVQISYSRTTDVFVDLTTRANMANKANADIFVSFHINSAENNRATGLEIWTSKGQTAGDKLATAIGEQLQKDFPNIAFRKDMSDGDLDKESNFTVLTKTKMAACLVEYMFIVNPSDAQILRTKQDEFAESTAKGILNYLKIKYIDTDKSVGFPIMSKTKATVEQMKEWAKRQDANQLFIDLAPDFFEIANKVGVNPLVAYCQSAKETGYMKFGGVINASFNNPCGLKTKAGGGNADPNAHQRFKSWREGIQAQVDHLALYAGAPGYPKPNTPDPRHFPYLKGTAKTVEELGGKWAPAKTYGTDILDMMTQLGATTAVANPSPPKTHTYTHVVQAGDTLSSIAAKYGTTYQKIAADNNVKNPNIISIGQKLTIKTVKETPKQPEKKIIIGSKVKIKPGSKTYTGGNLAKFAYNNIYDVQQISGNRVVIGINGQITAAIKLEDLILQ